MLYFWRHIFNDVIIHRMLRFDSVTFFTRGRYFNLPSKRGQLFFDLEVEKKQCYVQTCVK